MVGGAYKVSGKAGRILMGSSGFFGEDERELSKDSKDPFVGPS